MTMPRYIDADALWMEAENLWREIAKVFCSLTEDGHQMLCGQELHGVAEVIQLINNAPTVDVVDASEYKRLCNKLSREERRVRKLKKRIEELEQKGTHE